jgi:hypothetical protein
MAERMNRFISSLLKGTNPIHECSALTTTYLLLEYSSPPFPNQLQFIVQVLSCVVCFRKHFLAFQVREPCAPKVSQNLFHLLFMYLLLDEKS